MHLIDAISGSDTEIALATPSEHLSYRALGERVDHRANFLKQSGAKRVAIQLDNSIEWVLFDLACQALNLCTIPIPDFFSAKQVAHVLEQASVDTLVSGPLVSKGHEQFHAHAMASPFDNIRIQHRNVVGQSRLPIDTQKITFTSGSTGEPRGVCLSVDNQMHVAQSLVDTIDITGPHHLCLLPLATLLENIAGIYAPLLAGGKVTLLDGAERGFKGSSLVSIENLLAAISQIQPDTLILVPELLVILVSATKFGWQPPESLQFIAVGGGKVSAQLLADAFEAGLPVFEGYGLSECASVVSLNAARHNLPGTVGKVLPHLKVTTEDGELVVSGNVFLGYLNQPDSWNQPRVYTGDMGDIDANGQIRIRGRKKNLLITSYGRNVNPEWPESELMSGGLLRQAVVFGEAKPFCVALVVPAMDDIDQETISNWIERVNAGLPDYARIERFVCLDTAMSAEDGLYTENGRPKREAIAQHHAALIDSLYAAVEQPA
jgi:long-chain acyl-CoA synthetase